MKFITSFLLKYPYSFSFLLSCIFMGAFLFYSSTTALNDKIAPPDALEFLDFDAIQAPKKIVKQEISTEEGEVSDAKIVDKATGTSDSDMPDLDYDSGIVAPSPIGKLKKYFPDSAKKEGTTATVKTQLTIAASGIVKYVFIAGVIIDKKNIPTDLKNKLKKDFSIAAKKTLLGAQFSQPLVNGKLTPLKMTFTITFNLE